VAKRYAMLCTIRQRIAAAEDLLSGPKGMLRRQK